MAATYDDWMKRGREHIAAGRALDALSCFRQAVRRSPQAAEPFGPIAEAFWRLGKTPDAIAAWRESAARAPGQVATWQSLMAAGAFVDDDTVARSAAGEVQKRVPGNRMARFVMACAALAGAASRDAAVATLIELVDTRARFVEDPPKARMLARALASLDAGEGVALRRAIAGRGGALPVDLVAGVAAEMSADALRASIDGAAAVGDIEPLRRIALAARSQHAADRFGELAAKLLAPAIPLQWPRRTAGDRVRIVVVCEGGAAASYDDAMMHFDALLDALLPIAARVDLAVTAYGDPLAVVDRLRPTSLAHARVAQMPDRPDSESARTLAASDPDLLFDLCALGRPSAAVLAARPARKLLSIDAVPHLAVPLVDALLPADRGEWRAAVAAQVESVDCTASSRSSADVLHARLAEAIDMHRAGRLVDAEAICAAIIEEQPRHAHALHLRGALRREAGDVAGAARDFADVLAIAPADARARTALAQMMLAEHRPREAREMLATGLAAEPGNAPMLRALGHAALAERDAGAAVNAFAAALAVEPFDAETHFNHGVALQMLRYVGDAARAYQRALDIDASLVEAHFNLGIVFDQLGQVDAAIGAIEYVLRRQPGRAEAHRTLLDVLSHNDRGDAWMKAFERFEARCPDALGLVANALEFYQYRGDFAKVHEYLHRLSQDEFKPASELDLVDSLEQLLYLMLFFDADPRMQASLYSTYDAAVMRVYGARLPRPGPRRGGPLRIGYLSADFRDHVMGKMMLPVIGAHDRTRFEIHLYSTSESEDQVTASFRALGDRYTVVAPLSDLAAAQRIAADDLDVLVDLSTHTRGARPGILARKPARIQLTHVASAGALGMSAVDYKLTDTFADLPENDDLLIETLLPMEGSAYPFRRIAPAAGHPFTRSALGIAEDAIVIGAFVTPLKLSRRTLALWKEVLDRIPRARLAFSPNAPWMREIYPALAGAAQIGRDRLVMLPQGRDEAEGLARYDVVDFVLDPMPFGNVNGTIEPLNCAVPVVTLCGRTHGERTGYSILANLGVTSTIAMSGREYVDIAVRLADDAGFRDGVRRDIRDRLADSPLTDMRSYARRFEAAILDALERGAEAASA